MFVFKNKTLPAILIGLIAALIFIPLIGNCPLFDWDEVNFAECAREMIVSGDYSHVQLNYRPFWEKPPLFIWMQALSMNIFGVNEFAARLPNAICSIVTLICIFLIGSNIHSQKFGFMWCLLYVTSLLPHFYFKTGIIDPWFNLFIFLSLYQTYLFLHNPSGKKEFYYALSAGLFLGLAVLTKGPAAIVIAAFTILIFLLWKRQLKILGSRVFLTFTISTVLVSSSWFLMEWFKGNGEIIREFIDYQMRLAETQDSGHGGPFLYHFLVLLIGCFPASLIFIAGYFRREDLVPFQKNFRLFLLCLFWVVLLLFSIIETKIVHYSSLCYFPITCLGALALVNTTAPIRFSRLVTFIYWTCVVVLGIASVTLGLFKFLREPLLESGLINDEFALHNLMAEVHWTGYEFLIGLVFLLGSILIFVGVQRNRSGLLMSGLLCNGLFIVLTINIIVPKAEQYIQRAAIEFYKICAKEHCYVETHGYKSYAYLFYSDRKPQDFNNPEQIRFIESQLDAMEKQGYSRTKSFAISNQLWMEHGKIDRPAFIVGKKHQEQDIRKISGMKKIYELNGYLFFVRFPEQPAK